MSDIFTALNELESQFVDKFNAVGVISTEPAMAQFNQEGWSNNSWISPLFRCAHLNIIQTDKLYMMHCCIFPNRSSSSPIFGFDIFAGVRKITGFFHDFSPTTDINHPMLNWFASESALYTWANTRQLPDWARRIFSPHIIAASNIQDSQEIKNIKTLVSATTDYYIKHIESYNKYSDSTILQNYYCDQQQLNPNNAPVLVSLGLSQQQANQYIQTCLFPKIQID